MNEETNPLEEVLYEEERKMVIQCKETGMFAEDIRGILYCTYFGRYPCSFRKEIPDDGGFYCERKDGKRFK